MTEEERVKKINEQSAIHIQDFFEQLEKNEIESDDLLAITYAALTTAIILGYSPEALLEDAKKAATQIADILQLDN